MGIKDPHEGSNLYGLSDDEIHLLRNLECQDPIEVVRYDKRLERKERQKRKNLKNSVFKQRDGSVLRYALLQDKGTQYRGSKKKWFRTLDSKSLHVKMKKEDKRKQPKLGLWSAWRENSRLILIAADFDSLPKGIDSFEDLHDKLLKNYGEIGIVIKTISGKCKVLFQIEIIDEKRRDHSKAALIALEGLLDSALFEVCDKSFAALSITFVSPENVKLISERLEALRPVFNEGDYYNKLGVPYLPEKIAERAIGEPSVDIVCKNKTTEPIQVFQGMLNGLLDEFFNGSQKEVVVRALLCNKRLLRGAQVSQGYYARELGVNQSNVSRTIKALRKSGNLEIVGKYKVGKSGNRYKACGELKRALESIEDTPLRQNLPTFISDGDWNRTLIWVAHSHFSGDPEGFKKWAHSLDGWRLEDRRREIENICKKILNGII